MTPRAPAAFAIAVALLSALGACERRSEPAGPAPAASAAPGTPRVGPATSGDPALPAASTAGGPRQRPGLWEVGVETAGAPRSVERVCVTEAEAADPFGLDASQPGVLCGRQAAPTRRPDGAWVFRSTCAGESQGVGFTTVSTGTATGDFQSRFRIRSETVTTLNGEAAGEPTTVTVDVDAVHVGDCPVER